MQSEYRSLSKACRRRHLADHDMAQVIGNQACLAALPAASAQKAFRNCSQGASPPSKRGERCAPRDWTGSPGISRERSGFTTEEGSLDPFIPEPKALICLTPFGATQRTPTASVSYLVTCSRRFADSRDSRLHHGGAGPRGAGPIAAQRCGAGQRAGALSSSKALMCYCM